MKQGRVEQWWKNLGRGRRLVKSEQYDEPRTRRYIGVCMTIHAGPCLLWLVLHALEPNVVFTPTREGSWRLEPPGVKLNQLAYRRWRVDSNPCNTHRLAGQSWQLNLSRRYLSEAKIGALKVLR